MTIWDGPYFHYRGRYGHLKDHDFAYILWTHSFRQWNLAVYPQFGKRVDRWRGTSLSFQYFDWQELGTRLLSDSLLVQYKDIQNVTLQKGCDHSTNPCAQWCNSWVVRCRLGTEPFIISILRRPKPNLDDLGLPHSWNFPGVDGPFSCCWCWCFQSGYSQELG